MKKFLLLVISALLSLSTYAQSCDTLRNYDLIDPLYSFTGDDGYALGYDFLGVNPVTAWAEPYSVSSSIEARVIQFIP